MDDFDIALIIIAVCIVVGAICALLSLILQLWLFIESRFFIKAMAVVVLEYLGIDLKQLYKLYKQKGVSSRELSLSIRKAKHTKVLNSDLLQAIRKSIIDTAKLINKDETNNNKTK